MNVRMQIANRMMLPIMGLSLYFSRSQAHTYATATTKKTTVDPTNIRSLIGTNSPGALPDHSLFLELRATVLL